MSAQGYTRLASLVFAVIAVLQLIRAVLGIPITVGTDWGPISIPLWSSWLAFAAVGLLAWLGFAASRS